MVAADLLPRTRGSASVFVSASHCLSLSLSLSRIHTVHTIRDPTPGIGRRHHPENPAGPPVRRREEAAGGRRLGDAERGRILGVREAGLTVSCAHFFPAVSQSVGLWPHVISCHIMSCLNADAETLLVVEPSL